MYSEELIRKIEGVLKSNLTPYKIAKLVGYSSANPVHKLITKKSRIEHMTLEKAIEFEKLYDNHIKN